MQFWNEVTIRKDLACELANKEFFTDLIKRNTKGFEPKSNLRKEVKELVNQVETLRQLPNELRHTYL